jgi:hypothetical protein
MYGVHPRFSHPKNPSIRLPIPIGSMPPIHDGVRGLKNIDGVLKN